MPEKWTGRLIGEMHNNAITYEELARELGVTKSYISMILNGKKKPRNAKERLTTTVREIINRKTAKIDSKEAE